MANEKLILATFNFQEGGWSRHDRAYRNLPLLKEVVAQVPDLDILFLQEGFRYAEEGQRALFEVERILAPVAPLRGFLTRSDRGLLHEVIFMRWPRLMPVRHYEPGPGIYHDQIGWLHAHLEGDLDRSLALKSVHWPHWSGDARLDEALKLTRHAAPGSAAIIAGDFNSLWPGPQEFEPDWLARPPHKRLHKTMPPGARADGELRSDRRALTVLSEAGFVNAGSVDGDYTVTVNDAVDDGQGARIDHVLLSPWLAPSQVPGSYRVWVNELGDRASDHRMVSVAVDLKVAR
ncbi:endonuclease/exonuclease/phosphatase family protein [Streptosporangium sp. NBC_01469]|uniref:endonuclease/exonuclease/phosphatase family protein n=1 Tax=Streptosporangium sp. NBC_01469 TaxID=2903898 RepID=UPI002E2A1906|nr:endonuclease/exonuclease/phosphatase family protein [Streptosporangium sp. NBC_01469]